ncbi:MAG: nucleotidyl transferase AbiEii/AbiGii toxin family protein [Planctomycetota bacterium]|nr:nucleotidyl transferase AbiEii/AbiGii toxin family protein [Planctomycetota bacterium]
MTLAYEQLLNDELTWALREGSRHFEEQSAVYQALRKITQRLNALGIPYAIAGGMALFSHGFRRFTEDIDILVTREGLEQIHRELEGLGYVPVFSGSKNLRDAELGVRIEFLVAGGYPGDGKPKPVQFPHPLAASEEKNGIRWLSLPALINLKLASGLTNSGRLRDLADIQELIRLLRLPADYAMQLQLFVRDEFRRLWQSVQAGAAELPESCS